MKVTVIDYGLSNLLSVRHAFAHFGAETLLTSDPADVLAAESWCCRASARSRTAWTVWHGWADRADSPEGRRRYAAAGICLGMQMLFDESEEFGLHKGLGLFRAVW